VISFPPAVPEFLIGLLFDLEDGDNMFLQNIVLSPNYASVSNPYLQAGCSNAKFK
jgi:hypothetical protein